MLWSIVLSFGIASGVLADSISLFNVDPGSPVSAYEAGVTNGVTTYLLGCNASASATGVCDFTAPVTLIEGPNTFHVAITKPLPDGVLQSLTVDCPSGTGGACSVTALNTASQTTTISFPAASFSVGVTAVPTVASPQALLYNGIPVPTSSSSTASASSSSNSTITSTSSSYSSTSSPTGVYGNSTTTTKGTITKAGPSSTSSLSASATTTKSGAGSQYLGAQAVVYAGLVAVVFLAGNL